MDMTDIEKAKSLMTADLSSNARVDTWLEIAVMQVSKDYFGNKYPLALCYFASHYGTLENRGNGEEVGSLTSKSEGSISVSYSPAGSGTDDDLLQTTWGRMYLNLRNAMRPGPCLTGSFGGLF